MGLLLARDAFLKKHVELARAEARPAIQKLAACGFSVRKSPISRWRNPQPNWDSELTPWYGSPVDDQFRMSPWPSANSSKHLQAQDLLPMAIVATAGTTDFGSIDPTRRHRRDCPPGRSMASRGCRLRWRSSVLPSPSRQAGGTSKPPTRFHRLPQALLAAHSVQRVSAARCTAFRLHQNARRLSQPRSHEAAGIPDLVTTSVLTSRRFDALKLWISFQTLGREKLAADDRSHHLFGESCSRDNPQEPAAGTHVRTPAEHGCFSSAARKRRLDSDQLSTTIRQQLFDSGRAVIGHTRVRNHQCLKFTCMNPAARDRH